MLPAFDRGWIAHVTSAFLIRHPARVLASYARAWTPESLADIGVPQQAEIFDRVADRLGRAPPVVDAADVLADPRGILSALCVELDIPFSERMLAWPRGRRASDGIWAPVWYAAVERSTGFAAPDTNEVVLPSALARLAEAAQPTYERLSAHRLCPTAAPATPASRSARP